MSDKFKTNAMRILDKEKITYKTHSYSHDDGLIDGISIANKMNLPFEKVFKTLVTQGSSKNFFVFVIPVDKELNLKAAAKAVGEKSVEMIAVKDINKVTGYIRGGCSPIGMKKQFTTVIDNSCLNQETIIFSAGKIGHQIEMSPSSLAELINAKTEPIVY